MTTVAGHYMHFLTLGNFGNGTGWYAPKELDTGQGLGRSSLVVPVQPAGNLFAGYWAWVITLDEGAPRLLDEPFEVSPDGDGLKMELPSAWIRLTVSKMAPQQYRGTLAHPDFRHPFVAISPVEDEAYNLLFPQDKAVIIGVDSDEYR
jgi:hypothetical protein